MLWQGTLPIFGSSDLINHIPTNLFHTWSRWSHPWN
jgi:hypothetical protein